MSVSSVRFRGSVVGEVLEIVDGVISIRNVLRFVADMQRPANSVSRMRVNMAVTTAQIAAQSLMYVNGFGFERA